MPTIKLTEDRWYNRQLFKAGEAVEVPQELHDLITLERVDRARNGRELLLRSYDEKTVDNLQAAGFLHPDDVANADEAALLAVKGIGPQTVKRLKAQPVPTQEQPNAQPE